MSYKIPINTLLPYYLGHKGVFFSKRTPWGSKNQRLRENPSKAGISINGFSFNQQASQSYYRKEYFYKI